MEKHKQTVQLRTGTPFSVYNNKRDGGGRSPQASPGEARSRKLGLTLYQGPALQTGFFLSSLAKALT